MKSAARGGLARMERALAQFFLDTHADEHGYTEVSPPLLVRDNALYGTGQLPKFAEDLFATKDTGHFLIPTSEVPLTNMVADQIVDAESLPRRYTIQGLARARHMTSKCGFRGRGVIARYQVALTVVISKLAA